MSFLTKTRKKLSYETRIKQLLDEVNKKGQVSLDDLVKKWLLDPAYIKRLIRMAMVKYQFLYYDDENELLKIKEEAKNEKKGGEKRYV
jgi:hypothetical protein